MRHIALRRWAALCWAALLIAAVILGATSANALRRDKLTLHTAQGAHVIDIEIADTPQEKALGLMYRTSLPEKTGMLFVYETPQEITMWMRNTYIALDMVFIRGDGIVHRIEARTEPFSETIIPSRGNVTAVLELVGGAAARLGLKPGDRVEYKAFKPAAGRK